ncbi:MAG: hypothetical protein U5O15_06920 [Candidatus Krumholzibacteriota bacterium]|nr:hypothetical protein [Candidatus Krumholzibacteriota bacterium]
MNRTIIIDVLRAFAAVWRIRAEVLIADLVVLSLGVHSVVLGLCQIKKIDEIRIFRNRPQYFINFSIGFNLIFPAALAALLLARELSS